MSLNRSESISTILPFVHADRDDLNESFDKVEREVDLEFELKQTRADLKKTRSALAAQTAVSERISCERQIEAALQEYCLTPEAAKTVVKLVMKGDGGPLELNAKGQLVEKFGPRRLPEFLQDYLRVNDHLLGTDKEGKKVGPPALDKRTMSAKAIADFIEKNGQAAFHALPSSPDPRKTK